MILFGLGRLGLRRKGNSSAQPKGHSVLGALFIPDVGSTLRPLKETTSVFVKLLALIFAMNGLLPKTHPALSNEPGTNPNLSQILSDAWNNLSFTREGAPKVALFIAVVGTLICSTLAIFTIFMLMFFGKAHAQTSFFTPPDPTNDLAYNWLQFIFNPSFVPSDGFSNSVNMAVTTGVQTALITALSYYSNAILIFAAFILFYHLVSMVVETAHHGTPMGKRANQIWAPIRLVVAVGLLVPVTSTGLNCGQYIAIQTAEWGSGLASNVWNVFTNAFVNVSYAVPPAPYVRGLARSVVDIEGCMLAYNYYSAPLSSTNITTYQIQAMPLSNQASNVTGAQFIYPAESDGNNCGSYSFNPPSASTSSLSSAYTSISSAQQTALTAAFSTAQSEISSFFTLNSSNGSFLGNGIDIPQSAWVDVVGDVASAYQTSLISAVDSAASSAQASSSVQASQWESLGWLAAGAFFNDMARAQDDLETAAVASKPTITGPVIHNIPSKGGTNPDGGMWQNTSNALANLNRWLDEEDKNGNGTTLPAYTNPTSANSICGDTLQQFTSSTFKALNDAADKMVAKDSKGNLVLVNDIQSNLVRQYNDNLGSAMGFSIVDILANMLDTIAAMNCVWMPASQSPSALTPTGSAPPMTLGINFTSVNPYIAMVRLGHGNLNTAYFLINLIAVSELISASDANKLFGIFSIAGSILNFIALIFFIAGFTLAYFLPLIPFITFFMNAITWVVMVLESVIMMPLVALAHINPEGDGLPGQNAKNAYFFLFSIMLRPTLMIFGLIAAWLIFTMSCGLMNQLYMIAVHGAMSIGSGGTHVYVSRLFFSMMYVAILYIITTKSFQLVGSLPSHAMSWIGTSDAPKEPIGQAENLGGVVQLASGYAGQQMVGTITGMGQAIRSSGPASRLLLDAAGVAALGGALSTPPAKPAVAGPTGGGAGPATPGTHPPDAAHPVTPSTGGNTGGTGGNTGGNH